jgi:hypothetical protein
MVPPADISDTFKASWQLKFNPRQVSGAGIMVYIALGGTAVTPG